MKYFFMENKKLRMESSITNTNLFWTGGWDSSFRLLQLLLIEKRKVQTYYILRSEDSSGYEIDAMVKIRHHLFKDYPFTRDLLSPLKIFDSNQISKIPEIEKEYRKLIKSQKINIHYKDLAEFCEQQNLENVEIGIIKSKDYEPKYNAIEGKIFSKFSYPLIHLSKKDINTIARKEKWSEIMHLTFFCRRPKNGKACGICGPCTDAFEAGLGGDYLLKAESLH